MQFRVLIFTIIICQPLLEATERRGLTLVTHSYRLHSICSSLLLYVQSNFTDTPVSKYVCQSQTLTHPFKTLLSQSFTPELFTGPLGPFDLLSSNLSFQLNYKNPPSLPACHLPCGTAESVNSSVQRPQKMCVFAHFICYRVSKDLLILKISVYKRLFSVFWPYNLQHVFQCT